VSGPERARLHDYFRRVDEIQDRLRGNKPTDSRLRLMTKNLVPPAYRGTARMWLTDLSRPLQRRKLEAVKASGDPLQLHLGCGGEPKAGWINIDFVGDPVQVAWNLANGVPFEDNSVAAIFHEHMLEHIPLQSGAGLMDECFRVLEPGGILRIGVPDAGKLLESYNGDGTYLESIHPDRPTRLLAVQELFYWHRHTTMFDTETLTLMFKSAGFEEPKQREFGETDLEAAPDTERRRAETMYMEARKPE
jgi:predicted SAM-dependent methyltransferase